MTRSDVTKMLGWNVENSTGLTTELGFRRPEDYEDCQFLDNVVEMMFDLGGNTPTHGGIRGTACQSAVCAG